MIEDQIAPKRCGHTKGKSVVGREEAYSRVRAACDARYIQYVAELQRFYQILSVDGTVCCPLAFDGQPSRNSPHETSMLSLTRP